MQSLRQASLCTLRRIATSRKPPSFLPFNTVKNVPPVVAAGGALFVADITDGSLQQLLLEPIPPTIKEEEDDDEVVDEGEPRLSLTVGQKWRIFDCQISHLVVSAPLTRQDLEDAVGSHETATLLGAINLDYPLQLLIAIGADFQGCTARVFIVTKEGELRNSLTDGGVATTSNVLTPLREVLLSTDNAVDKEVTAAALHPSGCSLVVGFSSGNVILVRCRFWESTATLVTRNIRYFPSGESRNRNTGASVTALFTDGVSAGTANVFVVTARGVAAVGSNGNVTFADEVDEENSIVAAAFVEATGMLAVARTGGVISLYTAGQGNVAALPLGANVLMLSSHKEFLLVLQAATTGGAVLSALLLSPRLLCLSTSIDNVTHFIPVGPHGLVVSCQSPGGGMPVFLQFQEKPLLERLAVLLRRKYFTAAEIMMDFHKCDPKLQKDIKIKKAHWLCENNRFAEAVDAFCEVWDAVEVSDVVDTFVKAKQLSHLAKFLEHLHMHHAPVSPTTTRLLVQILAVSGKDDELRQLSRSDLPALDWKLFLDECRLVGRTEIAKETCEARGLRTELAGLLVEDMGDAEAAVDILLNKASAEETLAAVLSPSVGPALVKAKPAATIALLKRISEELKLDTSIFVPLVAAAAATLPADSAGQVESDLLNLLMSSLESRELAPCQSAVTISAALTLLFKERHRTGAPAPENAVDYLVKNHLKSGQQRLETFLVSRVLDHSKAATTVAQGCAATDGSAQAMVRRDTVPWTIAVPHAAVAGIPALSSSWVAGAAAKEPSLWLEAFAACAGDAQQIQQLISQDTGRSPMELLLVLNKAQAEKNTLTVGDIKENLLKSCEKMTLDVKESTAELKRDWCDAREKRKQLAMLRGQPILFAANGGCKLCGRPLKFPIMQFLCGHAYHKECLESDNAQEEPRCESCASCLVEAHKHLQDRQTVLAQMPPDGFFHSVMAGDDPVKLLLNLMEKGALSDHRY